MNLIRCFQLRIDTKLRKRQCLQEKTRAAAAPRKPKNGAVSSPLNVVIFSDLRTGQSFKSEKERVGFLQRPLSLSLSD